MTALLFIWNHRTMAMSAAQIVLSQVATSGLIGDYAVKWCMLGTGILTGLIALHNTIKERAARAAEPQPEQT